MSMGFPGQLKHMGIETFDYSWFEFDDLNRIIRPDAIAALKDDFNEDIKDNEYPFQSPIVIYWVKGMSKGIIQQGHHRYTICKDEKRQIRYIITNSYRPSYSGQEGKHQDWATEDLVASYARNNIEPYVVLQKLQNEHPGYSFVVLTTFINGYTTSTEKIRESMFRLDVEDKSEAYGKAKQRIIRFEEFGKAAERDDKPKETVKCIVEALERQDFDWKYFIERATANASESRLRPEFKSISTKARAEALIQFLYNHNSRKNFYF